HTNTAIGAITRLANMGVQPYLLSNSVVGLVAQRLVRVLCASCKVAHEPDSYERKFLNLADDAKATIYRAEGCEECSFEGYRGRQGIYEVIVVDDGLRELIHTGAAEPVMEKHVRLMSEGIRDNGRAKILAGLTTMDEILRVTMAD
ncbi:MAG: GspE/PulE family protein, partial [Pseudomonadales bacterium]